MKMSGVQMAWHPGLRVSVILAVLIAGTALLRLPFICFGPGMQDEHWFSAPGWTVSQEGVPRIPYVPVDDRKSVFYGAHKVLYALPPALFYVQAPWFAIFPATYATARLPSLLSGMIALVLLYAILRRFGVRSWIAVASVGLCGLSRPFFFAWANARPDMLCAAFGLAAMYYAIGFLESPTRRQAALAGTFVGLGLLTHPFGIVFALQLTGAVLFSHSSKWPERLKCLVLSGVVAAAVLALWTPLILLDTKIFWIQFSNNVLSRSGPGLLTRLIWPWGAASHQAALFAGRAGAIQTFLCAAAIVSGAMLLLASSRYTTRSAIALAFAALYFHLASVGTHTVIDYWCYTWAWVVVLIALTLERLATAFQSRPVLRLLAPVLTTLMLIGLLPGSGVRAFWVYLTRNDELAYNRSAFCRSIAGRLPQEARLVVASDYVFEFETLGRKPVNASRQGLYHDVAGLEFDYWVASRSNTLEQLPQSLGCKKLHSFGHWDDSLACYVDIYGPPDATDAPKGWPR